MQRPALSAGEEFSNFKPAMTQSGTEGGGMLLLLVLGGLLVYLAERVVRELHVCVVACMRMRRWECCLYGWQEPGWRPAPGRSRRPSKVHSGFATNGIGLASTRSPSASAAAAAAAAAEASSSASAAPVVLKQFTFNSWLLLGEGRCSTREIYVGPAPHFPKCSGPGQDGQLMFRSSSGW